MNTEFREPFPKMMEYLSRTLWQRFRRSPAGRIFAAAIIAGTFGAFAAAHISPTLPDILGYTLLSAAIGVFAVGLLERRDRRRRNSAKWNSRVENTSGMIQKMYPELPPEATRAAAKSYQEQRMSPIVLIGIVLGALCVLCGVAMAIVQAIRLFSS
jgi:uncharacterized membrane protein YfcA